MIRSLEDVERVSQEHARAAPLIADAIELRGPGLNDLEIAHLRKHLPGLPDDYLQIARTWRLDSISIGYFNLRPPTFANGRGLIDGLVAANSPENPLFKTLQSFQLLEIASYEGDPLCVGATHTARAAHIFRFALPEDVELRPRFVARSFEDMLKAATELRVFWLAERLGRGAVEEFLLTIHHYVPDLALGEWRSFAEEALQPL